MHPLNKYMQTRDFQLGQLYESALKILVLHVFCTENETNHGTE